eukprot:2625321-Amphidinium_carterae.1
MTHLRSCRQCLYDAHKTHAKMAILLCVVSIRVEDDEERALVQAMQVGTWDADSETIEVCCRPIGTNVREGEKITEALRFDDERVKVSPQTCRSCEQHGAV